MRASVVLLLLALCGCDKSEPPQKTSSSGTMSEHPPIDRRSTPGELAVHNLEEALKQIEAGLKKDPKSIRSRETLVAVLLQRASFLGKVSDLKRALEVADETVKLEEKNPRALRLRARAHAAAYRFTDAIADLDAAEKVGAKVEDTRSARGTSLMGLGQYDEAYELLHEHRQKIEDSTSLAHEAAVLGRMNRQGEADKLFQKAIEKYRGTSPFGIAWIYFEQGSMLDRAGDKDRARELYKKAVEKLPVYAHAVGHLAVLVPPAEGQALLEAVVGMSDDPEYRALLGGIQEKRRPGAGKALIEQAQRGYERAMKELPLAFADHAGWFYVDVVKDAARALEVAELNLAARPVPEAFELAVAAQLAAGKKVDACKTADRALELKYVTAAVKRRAAEAYAACGKKDQASELDVKAGPRPR